MSILGRRSRFIQADGREKLHLTEQTPAILGIDAAWTASQPSGVTLIRREGAAWQCVAVAPSYGTFVAAAKGQPVDWSARAVGAPPQPEQLLEASRVLLGGGEVQVVAVDMPLSRQPITGRRASDGAISRAFGAQWCAAHSPSPERPGPIGAALTAGFTGRGFPLTTTAPVDPGARHLIEVYPHPALLTLLSAERRLPYKVSKIRSYWPDHAPAERYVLLGKTLDDIAVALSRYITGIPETLVSWPYGASPSALKRREDALDALVCAWVGAELLAGRATPYGDEIASIWVP